MEEDELSSMLMYMKEVHMRSKGGSLSSFDRLGYFFKSFSLGFGEKVCNEAFLL